MLLFVLHELWCIIDDSCAVVSSVVPSYPALLSFHMLAGHLDRAPWPPEDSTGGPLLRPAGSIDNERTGPVGWNGHTRSILNDAARQRLNSRRGHEEQAWSTPFHQAQ